MTNGHDEPGSGSESDPDYDPRPPTGIDDDLRFDAWYRSLENLQSVHSGDSIRFALTSDMRTLVIGGGQHPAFQTHFLQDAPYRGVMVVHRSNTGVGRIDVYMEGAYSSQGRAATGATLEAARKSITGHLGELTKKSVEHQDGAPALDSISSATVNDLYRRPDEVARYGMGRRNELPRAPMKPVKAAATRMRFAALKLQARLMRRLGPDSAEQRSGDSESEDISDADATVLAELADHVNAATDALVSVAVERRDNFARMQTTLLGCQNLANARATLSRLSPGARQLVNQALAGEASEDGDPLEDARAALEEVATSPEPDPGGFDAPPSWVPGRLNLQTLSSAKGVQLRSPVTRRPRSNCVAMFREEPPRLLEGAPQQVVEVRKRANAIRRRKATVRDPADGAEKSGHEVLEAAARDMVTARTSKDNSERLSAQQNAYNRLKAAAARLRESSPLEAQALDAIADIVGSPKGEGMRTQTATLTRPRSSAVGSLSRGSLWRARDEVSNAERKAGLEPSPLDFGDNEVEPSSDDPDEGVGASSGSEQEGDSELGEKALERLQNRRRLKRRQRLQRQRQNDLVDARERDEEEASESEHGGDRELGAKALERLQNQRRLKRRQQLQRQRQNDLAEARERDEEEARERDEEG